jgi:hypothetical protein
MFELIEMAALVGSGAAVLFSYFKTRSFVRRRLRYVDDVQKGSAPVVAGTVATLAAAPVVWLLPVVGAPAAVAFGVAVGMGTRAGARDIRNGTASAD